MRKAKCIHGPTQSSWFFLFKFYVSLLILLIMLVQVGKYSGNIFYLPQKYTYLCAEIFCSPNIHITCSRKHLYECADILESAQKYLVHAQKDIHFRAEISQVPAYFLFVRRNYPVSCAVFFASFYFWDAGLPWLCKWSIFWPLRHSRHSRRSLKCSDVLRFSCMYMHKVSF